MVPECFDLESKKELFFSSEMGVRDSVSGVIEENWFDFSAAEEFSKLSAGEQRARVEADLQDVRKNKTLSTGRRERLMRFFSSMKNLVSLSAMWDSEETECGDSVNLEFNWPDVASDRSSVLLKFFFNYYYYIFLIFFLFAAIFLPFRRLPLR